MTTIAPWVRQHAQEIERMMQSAGVAASSPFSVIRFVRGSRELMLRIRAAGVSVQVPKPSCPAPSHFSPSDDRYNTKLITTADCGWCGEPVVVRS